MRTGSPSLFLLQVQTGEGQERAGRCPEASSGSGLTDRSVCMGGSLRPAFRFTAEETPSIALIASSLCSWGPCPPILEVLLAERLAGGAENSDSVSSLRPKAFAPTTLCLESPHLRSARVCAHAHVHTHTRMAGVLSETQF